MGLLSSLLCCSIESKDDNDDKVHRPSTSNGIATTTSNKSNAAVTSASLKETHRGITSKTRRKR